MKFEISPKETETILNWFDAKLYCFSLNIDGKTGWRLPTLDELDYIYGYEEFENDFVGANYWTATEFNDDAWFKHLLLGYQNRKSKDSRIYVRAVRDL